jgi:hypothetical protein
MTNVFIGKFLKVNNITKIGIIRDSSQAKKPGRI